MRLVLQLKIWRFYSTSIYAIPVYIEVLASTAHKKL